tara:strand:- start:1714 stop:2244 length:531 start_codon:yes stop_codon:yes gene_type:complete
MGKPNGAMGSPFGLSDNTEDMNIPTRYSHLPASEARAKIAAELKEAEDARIAALVEQKLQERLKEEKAEEARVAELVGKQHDKIVKNGVVGPTESQKELSAALPSGGEVSEEPTPALVYQPDNSVRLHPVITPKDFADLCAVGIVENLNVQSFDEKGLHFESGGAQYKIVKVCDEI